MPKKYKIEIIQTAEYDILDIYNYIQKNDSKASADHVLSEIENLIYSLEDLPSRGHLPFELSYLNLSNYLELHFKPYRVIYEIDDDTVYVHCVLDGRRDLQELLQRRLLR